MATHEVDQKLLTLIHIVPESGRCRDNAGVFAGVTCDMNRSKITLNDAEQHVGIL